MRRIAAIILFLCIVVLLLGAASFDVKGSTGTTTDTTTLTYSPTGLGTISGSNCVGWVDVWWGNAPSGLSVSTITWGGSSMTSDGSAETQGSSGTQGFWIANPSTSPSIVVTMSATETHDIVASPFVTCNTNQTTPIRSGTYGVTNTSTAATLSLTITSQTGDLVHSSIMVSNGDGSSTNQTLINNFTAGTRIGGADDYGTGASSVTDTWTATTGTPAMAMIGFSIAAASATTPVCTIMTTGAGTC